MPPPPVPFRPRAVKPSAQQKQCRMSSAWSMHSSIRPTTAAAADDDDDDDDDEAATQSMDVRRNCPSAPQVSTSERLPSELIRSASKMLCKCDVATVCAMGSSPMLWLLPLLLVFRLPPTSQILTVQSIDPLAKCPASSTARDSTESL